MRFLILLGFLLAFNLSCALAQESGYVIKDSGDTVVCSIKTAGVNGFKWKTDAEKDWKYFGGMKEFHLDQSKLTYQKKTLPDSTKVFLKVLEQGKINLYEYLQVYPGITTSDVVVRWYASKSVDDQVEEVKSNRVFNKTNRTERRQALYHLLAGQPTVLSDFKKRDYTFDEIRNAVHVYNTGLPLPPESENADEEQ